MIGICRTKRSLARRLYTALAVMGLLFAATVATITHSIAMPMMPAMAQASADHDRAAHDHGCDSAAMSDDDPAMPSAPCENGCLLCKSCSLASAVIPAHPGLVAAAPYRDYRMATTPVPAVVAPTLPNEPPRP